MKIFIPIIIILFISCNYSNNSKTPKITKDSTIRNTTSYKVKKYKEEKKKVYGADTISISYKDINLGKYKLYLNQKYFIIKSVEEASKVFLSCDSINNIDFDKYILIGVDRPTNGTEKITTEVLEVAKYQCVLVNINAVFYSKQKNIVGRYHKWILINKPDNNWGIKVLTIENYLQ